MPASTYKPSVTATKATETGAVATVVTGVASVAVDAIMADADPSTKGVLVGLLSGALLAGYKAFRNWLKHRNIK